MAGMQWCNACDGPRFKWRVYDLQSIPDTCWDCGKGEVGFRLAADSLPELRKVLAEWAGNPNGRRIGADRSWLNRSRSHARERFDQVIGWWAKQESRPVEFVELLKKAAKHGDTAGASRASKSTEVPKKLADANLIGELARQLKAQAEAESAATARTEAPEPSHHRPGAWKIGRRFEPEAPETQTLDQPQQTGLVKVTLTGSEKDPREIELPLVFCADQIRMEHDTWFARQSNGDVAIVRGGGDQRRASDWMHYFTDIYAKVDAVKANRVEYKFERTLQVNRCEATTKKNARCRNDALEHAPFCRTHELRAPDPRPRNRRSR